ncbi:MAG: glutathione S-transferase [Pseudomonadota bacterium]
MAHYKLHCFAQSGNAYKIALYLNCAGIDWEPVFVDFMKGGQTRDPDWRAETNSMGEAPVLEIDGNKLTQTGAILIHLARETGKFAPQGAEQDYEALRWILFDNHKFTSFYATHRFLYSLAPKPSSPDVMAFLRGRWEPAMKVVDAHLGDRQFMLGNDPTIADFSFAGYMFYPKEESGFDIPAIAPNIAAWVERMRALDGWADPYDLMPGDRVAPRQD